MTTRVAKHPFNAIAAMGLLFLALIFIAVGTRRCGPVPIGISADSAHALVQSHDTLASIDNSGSNAQYVCVTAHRLVGDAWPFAALVIVVLMILVGIAIYHHYKQHDDVIATNSIICPACGASNTATARVCAKCGRAL